MNATAALRLFLDALRAAKKSVHTLDAYERDIRLVLVHVGSRLDKELEEVSLSELRVPVLRAAFGDRATNASPSTMSRTHSAWTKFFLFLRSEGLATTNPIEEIERAKVGVSAVKSIAVDDLAAKLLTAAAASTSPSAWPRRDTALVAAFSQTGIRLAELVGLNRGSLTGPTGSQQITVVGKGRKARTIPITTGLARLLEQYQEDRADRFPDHKPQDHRAPFVVHPRTGERATRRQIQYTVERLYREAGVRGSVPEGALVHALRHTFAMDLLSHGADIVELQTLLGHSSLNTTRRYLTAQPDQLRAAIATSAASAAIDSLTTADASDQRESVSDEDKE